MTEVICLSQHLCSPCEGQLNAVNNIFRYVQNNLSNISGRISFDPYFVQTDEKIFEGSTRELGGCKDFYQYATKAHPRKKLEPLWETFIIWFYVDANHAGNLANRRVHPGILIYVRIVLINSCSKRQNTVESSSFSLEFVILKIATEIVEALRYKLMKFGVNLKGLSEVYGDNKSVETNSIVQESVLKRRHNAI